MDQEYYDILNDEFYNELKQAVRDLVDTAFYNVGIKCYDDEFLKRCSEIEIGFSSDLYSESDVRRFIDIAYYQAISDLVAEINNAIKEGGASVGGAVVDVVGSGGVVPPPVLLKVTVIVASTSMFVKVYELTGP